MNATTTDFADIGTAARTFVDDMLIPLEGTHRAREVSDAAPIPWQPQTKDEERIRVDPQGPLTGSEYLALLTDLSARGLLGLDVPREWGGRELGLPARLRLLEELGRSPIPFVPPPDSPTLLWLQEATTGEQRQTYLEPFARGERSAAIAVTEIGGSSLANIQTSAERTAEGDWTIDGEKDWVGHADWADFSIVVAKTTDFGEAPGLTAFIVERGTTGFTVVRKRASMGHYRPCQIRLERVRVPDRQRLGPVGQAFGSLQRRFAVRRLEHGARSLGAGRRALELMIARASTRSLGGVMLGSFANAQAWIADAASDLHLTQLATYDAAERLDAGDPDAIRLASLVKVAATERCGRIIDRAIQLHGAEGLSADLPLEAFARYSRGWRIAEGPSEAHRSALGRHLIAGRSLTSRLP